MNTEYISRKEFLNRSAMFGAGLMCPAAFTETVSENKVQHKLKSVGLILGVLNEEMKRDWRGTLERVAAIGYTHIEYGGHYGEDIFAFKKFLKSVGLRSLCGGSAMAQMRKPEELKRMVEDALVLDKKYMVCYWPWMDGGENKKLADFKKVSDDLNQLGEQCRELGMPLAFHNHDKELAKTEDGTMGLDVIMANTDPALVCLELDLYWTVRGGGDPVEILKRHGKRIKMFHVKDMDKTVDKKYTCPGYGVIDFASIFKVAAHVGVEHYTVEVDETGQPIQCIEDSYKHLMALRF